MESGERGCGGFASAVPADDYVHEITNNIRKDVELNIGRSTSDFTPTIARHGAVGGTAFYIIKIHLGNGEYAHARVQQNLDQTQSLVEVIDNQTESSPIKD
eukprot:TRINITY_DN6443_c0_g1_i1.p1 TRINITY_DN6443_c0_g1~~TRINITY_DN6443_c0_g1_i1.p1  ORF type:complete len:101 (-),score=15.16 TRINITY_DN6443_c0_g1_i1:97-399(-)